VEDDSQLVARAQTGDQNAFAELVRRYRDRVFRLAVSIIGKEFVPEAEDVAQEVCARLGKAVAGYRGGAAFTTWLYAIVLNAARDSLRRSAREMVRAEAFGVHAALVADTDPASDDPAETLWAAVRALPDKQREAVTLVYGEGLSHAEAADIMAVAEPTVSWHVHEAKKRLRALLRPAEDV